MTYLWVAIGSALGGIARYGLTRLTGSFVRRAARTPHYDGVIVGAKEPAVVAICGLAPIDMRLVDPSQPILKNI
jgi:hypothetical protein